MKLAVKFPIRPTYRGGVGYGVCRKQFQSSEWLNVRLQQSYKCTLAVGNGHGGFFVQGGQRYGGM